LTVRNRKDDDDGVTTTLDADLARIRAHRNNIHRTELAEDSVGP
jgi:hypothetical protein